jgi:hypothetical protein
MDDVVSHHDGVLEELQAWQQQQRCDREDAQRCNREDAASSKHQEAGRGCVQEAAQEAPGPQAPLYSSWAAGGKY